MRLPECGVVFYGNKISSDPFSGSQISIPDESPRIWSEEKPLPTLRGGDCSGDERIRCICESQDDQSSLQNSTAS